MCVHYSEQFYRDFNVLHTILDITTNHKKKLAGLIWQITSLLHFLLLASHLLSILFMFLTLWFFQTWQLIFIFLQLEQSDVWRSSNVIMFVSIIFICNLYSLLVLIFIFVFFYISICSLMIHVCNFSYCSLICEIVCKYSNTCFVNNSKQFTV